MRRGSRVVEHLDDADDTLPIPISTMDDGAGSDPRRQQQHHDDSPLSTTAPTDIDIEKAMMTEKDTAATTTATHNNNTTNDASAAPRQPPSKHPQIGDPNSDPPDGGLHAWLKVAGCFLLYTNIWAFTMTFGAFQSTYQTTLLSSSSPTSISWIGTTQSWLLIVTGVLSGPLFDMGYYRLMLAGGNALVVLGVFMLSLSREYWQVFLAQAVCMGLGAGFLYIPSIALIGLSFKRRRSLAQGIVMSGIAAGGVSYVIAFDRLLTQRDFGWAVRALGFIALAVALISYPALVSGTAPLTQRRPRRQLFDPAALRDPSFWLFALGSLATFLGYIFPYFYISTYAHNVVGLSQSQSLYVLVYATSGSFFGRLACGVAAQFFGPILTWFVCALLSGVMCLAWMAVQSEAGLIVFSVAWGFGSAGLVTLPAAVFPGLCPDPRRLGTRTGMAWGISSIGSLIGSPIAAALLKGDFHSGATQPSTDFMGAQIFSAVVLLAGSALICYLWITTIRKRKSKTVFL